MVAFKFSIFSSCCSSNDNFYAKIVHLYIPKVSTLITTLLFLMLLQENFIYIQTYYSPFLSECKLGFWIRAMNLG